MQAQQLCPVHKQGIHKTFVKQILRHDLAAGQDLKSCASSFSAGVSEVTPSTSWLTLLTDVQDE